MSLYRYTKRHLPPKFNFNYNKSRGFRFNYGLPVIQLRRAAVRVYLDKLQQYDEDEERQVNSSLDDRGS